MNEGGADAREAELWVKKVHVSEGGADAKEAERWVKEVRAQLKYRECRKKRRRSRATLSEGGAGAKEAEQWVKEVHAKEIRVPRVKEAAKKEQRR